MTNIFIFETFPNTKLKEKKVGVHGILCPSLPEKIVPMQVMHIILTSTCKYQ